MKMFPADVAMDYAFGVRGVERVSDLDSQRQSKLDFDRPPSDIGASGLCLRRIHSNGSLSRADRSIHRWYRCLGD